MKNANGNLAAPFPWFGGKSNAVGLVWSLFGKVANYVEPFCGSAAMLLGAPDEKRVETINDADGFVANFWRAVRADSEAVAYHADWPCNEADLFARHSWLVRNAGDLLDKLHADPEFFDARIAGWWCWGACNWIGSGWCSGDGPWIHDGERIVKGNAGRGINRKLPHLSASQGINRQLPHLGNAGQGINRQLPHLGNAGQGERSEFIRCWMEALSVRLRDVRVACGDWTRVAKDSVTSRHGLTAVFLDPPYAKGALDYTAGGCGTNLSQEVADWAIEKGSDPKLRIVICGHAGEHDRLLEYGWKAKNWKAKKGYATTDAARSNTASETVWASPYCVEIESASLFEVA